MEMMSPDSGWYIDSWAALDGLVFASERDTNGETLNTVFLAPPYWSPVAVANLSTAWAASRMGFQSSFCDAEGAEIRFRTLDEIREVARRGYLSGGYGFLPPTNTDGAPTLTPELGEEAEAQSWWTVTEIIGEVETDQDRHDLSAALTRFYINDQIWQRSQGEVFDFLGKAAETQAKVVYNGPSDRKIRTDYAALMESSASVFGLRTLESWWPGPYPSRYYPWTGPGRLGLSAVLGLIFRFPVVRATRLETIGDHLILAATSRNYLRRMKSHRNLLPLLIGALYVTGASDTAYGYSEMSLQRIEEACQWIAANVPSVLAADHPAAVVLEEHIEALRREGPEVVRQARHAPPALELEI
jgi:hypothetical protein